MHPGRRMGLRRHREREGGRATHHRHPCPVRGEVSRRCSLSASYVIPGTTRQCRRVSARGQASEGSQLGSVYGGLPLTKRENASLNSETCSSVRESAWRRRVSTCWCHEEFAHESGGGGSGGGGGGRRSSRSKSKARQGQASSPSRKRADRGVCLVGEHRGRQGGKADGQAGWPSRRDKHTIFEAV